MLFVVLKQNTNLFNFIGETERQSVEEQADGGDDKQETQITEDDLEVGRNGYISSAQIIERVTGTGPWDDDDEPGNDSSPDNDIVRSFDQVTWTVNLTTALKEGAQQASYTGGVVEFTASLPDEYAKTEFAPYIEWDVDSMAWIEDANLSDDGITLTGKYSLSETETTLPGAQTLVFVLKLYGVANDSEFAPTFTFDLAGNEENEKQTLIDNTITVSAIGKYNIQLNRNTNLFNKTTVDYGQGETLGRMYGYGFTVQLYNEDESKELKGLELPTGEISFDIDLKLERSQFGSDELEDITDEATPILWNYRENNWNSDDLSGKIDGREMYYGENSTRLYNRNLPIGIDVGDRRFSALDSGDIKIIQNGSRLNVTINNYKFDYEYPHYDSQWKSATMNRRRRIYADNIGTFCVGYIQIFVPDTEANTLEDRNYYLTVSDQNMNIISSTQDVINNQMYTSDDTVRVQHVINRAGSYSQSINVYDKNNYNIATNQGSGDAKTEIGNVITILVKFGMSTSNDYDIYTANKFLKFDGEAYAPVYYDDGSKYQFKGNGNPRFRVWYVTKEDGTNWIDQEEMNNANIEDMVLYDNIEDVPDNKICVGIYIETIDGYLARSTGDNNNFRVLLKIKDTAEIGKTYGITHRTWYWRESLDRSTYTITNPDVEWPTPEWDSGNRNYIKTEYDENGQMISGTHSGGYVNGNTVLVVGANLHGNIKTVDETNAEKTNYDLGRNENIVTYSVEPALDANTNLVSQIENVTLKAEVTLPAGLTYVPGSSTRGNISYTEPEIIENSDRSRTLTWYLYGVTSGEKIEPILFDAQIENNTANNTQFETKFVVSEVIGEDGIAKIGNSEINFRTSTTAINIINMSSYRLYKETTTPIAEANGEITYRVVYQNSADSTVPEFQILDILPYNGDGRGTSYNGTYTLKNVKVTSTGDETSIENLKLYTTTSPEARKLSPKDESIGVSEIWQEKEIGQDINEAVTVIALKGEVGRNTNLEIEITLQTTNNRGGDVYYNQATAQIRRDVDVITTSNVRAEIVSRQITGTVWYDTNENGVIDADESKANRIEVELLKADGSRAVDYNGNEISNILTNSNGEYTFTNLPMGEYIVEIHTDDRYTLTTANVGTNREINSKFEETEDGSKQSYTITNLNGIQSPEILEENVNAGLVVKDAKIIVKYLEEDSTPETDEDNRVLKEQDEITTYEKDGEQVKYKLGDSYTTSLAEIENYISLRNSGNTNGTLNTEETIVTYYYTYNLQDIEVSKVWEDNHDTAQKRPASIKVTLKDRAEEVKEIVLNSSNFVATEQSGTEGISETAEVWQGTIEDVPVYTDAGQRISYTIDEKEDVGTLDSYNKTINGMVITNTFTQNTEKIEIPVTKVWEDSDNKAGKRPSNLTLILKREVGSSYVEASRATINAEENQGSNSNEWTYTFTDIAKYDENNNEIKYVVEEETSEFYTSIVENVENTEEGQDTIAFRITNTFEVPDEKVSYEVTKIWNDNNNRAGKRPEEVTLVLTGKNPQGEEVVEAQRITLTSENKVGESNSEENIWKGTIENLPKYDENADIINYELSEENLNSIFYTEANTTIDQASKTVTNRFEVPDDTIDVEVTKVWNDSNNAEGVRPENVTLYLTGNGREKEITLTKANAIDGNTEGETDTSSSWKGTITDLPKYDVNGNEINYVLDERPVTSEFYTKTNIDQGTKTVTNTFGIPTENIQITVTKIWEDNNNALGKRPENITLQIKNKATGEIVASQLMQGSSTSNDGWSYTFEVPKYAGSTDEVEYEIAEADLNNIFYTTENAEINQETRTITNRFAIPDATIELPVRKEWNHTNNNYKIPQEIKIQVKDETGAVVVEQVLNNSNQTEENVWEYTFTGLKKYNDQAEEKKYTIDEEAVTPGDLDYYRKEIDGTTIKNTYIGPIISQEKTAEISTTEGIPVTDREYVIAGETITYTITVKNDGGLSKDVVIKDTIPTGTTFISGSIEISNNENTSNLGTTELESGITVNVPAKVGDTAGTTTLSFKVTVQDLENGTEIKNIATVDNNNTNETTNTYLEPIISMEKTQETENKQDYVIEGEKITYAITVKNDGGLSKDVKIQDTIPEGTSFVEGSIKINGQARTELTQEKLVNGITESVPAKEGEVSGTLTVSFEVTVDNLPEGTYTKDITNTATVDETLKDTVQTAVKTSNVIPSKSSSPERGTEVKAGEEITYTIKLDNSTGTLPETVKVKDTVPEGTEFISESIKIGGQAQTNLTAENLSNGIDVTVEAESINTLEFKVKVTDAKNNGEMINNQATVEETSGKGTQTNETEHRYIEPIIDAVKTQTTEHPERDYVLEGETITYTITVSNTGDLETTVNVRDNIPAGTTLVLNSIQIIENAKENSTPKEGTFTQDNLENGIEVNVGAQNDTTITFQVTVDELQDGIYYSEIINAAVVDEEPTKDVRVDVYKPHITASKEAEPEEGTSLTANDSITYTITVRNDGRTDGTTTVKDIIPENTTFVEGSIKVGGEAKAELTKENLANGIDVEVAVGEETTVEFQVTVNDQDNGEAIRNVATYTDEDGEEASTEEVEHTYIEPIINAEKTSATENGLGYVVEGETITYTITVTNTGDLGKEATIQDNIPEGTTFVEQSVKVNGQDRTELTQENLEKGIQEFVNANDEITVSFDVTVDILPEGELRKDIVNTALVDNNPTDPVTEIVNKADVKAEKTSVPPSGETVEVGEEITYTITVSNDGTAPETAIVKDTIPTGTTFVDGSIVVEGSNENYELADLTTTGIEVPLNPDESKTVEFKVIVQDLDNGTKIRNAATVDDEPTNNTEHTYVEPIISGSKSVETENNLEYVVEGETITYTITATNTGDAEGVAVIQDTIPSGTTFVPESITVGEESRTELTQENLQEGIEVTVPARGEETVEFQVRVNDLPDGTYEGIIRNTATVNGIVTNEVTEETHKPNITATKESDPASDLDVTAGNTITYTIKLTNQGTAPGEVIVKDTIPTGTNFVRGSIKVGEQAQTSLTEDNLANGISVSLNAGETKNVEFKVTVNDIENGATIKNVATYTNEDRTETSTNEITHKYVEPIISSTKSQITENNLNYVVEGETITYTITVTNTGDLEKNVIIKDTIPEGTTFVDGSVIIRENGVQINTDKVYTESELEYGIEVNVPARTGISEEHAGTVTITFQVTVNDLPENTYQRTITNKALVDNVETNEVVEDVRKAHVRIGKTSDPASGSQVVAGQEIRYVIVLENKEGTAPSTLLVKDSIPEGTTFVEGSIKVKDIEREYTLEDLTTNGITVDIPAEDTRTVEFRVKVNDLDNGYIIRNKANITNPETQENKDTNEVTHEYVEAIIDAEKEMTTERELSYVIPGEKITYTITVQNEGDLSKTLTVQDSIPEGTEFVANSVHLNGMTSNITQDQLENGFEIEVAGKQIVTISFDVTVLSGATEVKNTAIVDGSSTNETKVPVVTYEKTAEVIRQTEENIPEGTVTTGDKIKYTIKINNLGEETIDSIVVKDTIPEGTTLSNINNDGIKNDRNEIKWNVTNLQPETSTEVSFEVTVNYDVLENKVITNVATVDDEDTNETETPYDKPEIKEK